MTALLPAWSDREGADRTKTAFVAAFAEQPEGVWAAPGRVNLIGEHVDYNGGLCLPIALPHRTFAAVRRRGDDRVRLVSAQAPDRPWQGRLAAIGPALAGTWPGYAAGPARVLLGEGYPLAGFDVAVDSCLPLGAGLSSSAAIECAAALALDDLFGLGLSRGELARVCVRAENEVAGAPTGGMDQAAALLTEAGSALLLDTRDNTAARIPFDPAAAGLALLVIDTRAPHALVDGQYAARRSDCAAAARRLGVETLREVADLEAAVAALDDPVQRRRVRHVVGEIARVEQCAARLRAGRMREVGELLDASHESLRSDFEVSSPELDEAVTAARCAGALGARMTGGGFGGSAIALVPAERRDAVAAAVAHAYTKRGWGEPGFLGAVPSAAGGRVA